MTQRAESQHPQIAVDTWVLGPQAINHGIQVYAKQLLANFQRLAWKYSVEILPYVSPDADNAANQFGEGPGFRPVPTRLLKHSRQWRWGGAFLLALARKVDLVFNPNCTTLYFNHLAPLAVTIHDLSPLVVRWGPQKISQRLKFFLRRAAQSSQVVITDSFHSQAELIRLYGIPESKISVVYLACDKETFNSRPSEPEQQEALLRRHGISRPYIVHHGLIKPYKNLRRLIQAYRLLLERNPNLDLELVLAGPLGWDYEEVLVEAERGQGSRGRVIFTHALPDKELAMLVKGAVLAVIPSLYEGFCLPLLEAMACGVPTIASNSTCLPEVSGGVLRYFDPRSIDDMASCMEEGLENETLRKELSRKGLLRAAKFDWQRCASETLAILSRLAHENRERRRLQS